jgi:hypothetical protein
VVDGRWLLEERNEVNDLCGPGAEVLPAPDQIFLTNNDGGNNTTPSRLIATA